MPALGPERAGDWCPVNVGATTVGVAERDALGTTARVVVWPPNWMGRALAAVDAELALLDEQASRFRHDSEISRLHNALASPAAMADSPLRTSCIVSEGLAEAIAVALAAAEWTGGLVDPTVGGAVRGLGYDRDFAALPQVTADAAPPEPGYVPGWQSVRLDGRRLRLAAGVQLDLGATAKGLGSDRAARAAAAFVPGGGVLVSLGGDVAVAGEAPLGGWPVLVSDEPEPDARGAEPVCPPQDPPGQQVRLPAGGLATSSIRCRRWQRGGRTLHHIVDPRTGLPATGPWRTASVAAASCAEANAAATAAIVAGEQATGWLAAQGLPARLVAHDGSVRLLGGWPATAGGLVEVPAAPRMPAAPAGRPEGTGRPADGVGRPAQPGRVR
ncbi:MAG TPA: FAD:protein FMN transferase [Streptosporangiaceae bacterium]|nr:FAD:protein FMN transferase [Streptosporangiaceae bacterium]